MVCVAIAYIRSRQNKSIVSTTSSSTGLDADVDGPEYVQGKMPLLRVDLFSRLKKSL